ncbi:MAG: hypothetical protein HYY62_04520 [Deltaproteobacteria bacterium]|nr:hypothetical protein [Deltaproteobacteria bacterium]
MKKRVFVFLLFSLAACDFRIEKFSGGAERFSDIPLEATFASIQGNIFQSRCISCHSAGQSAWRVPLDTREEVLNSPRELVIPGNADESGLIIAITRSDNKRMPPAKAGSALSQQEIEMIKQWINEGAL